jgi:hypothetical protein
MSCQLNPIDFDDKLNHAPIDYLNNVINVFETSFLVDINKNLNRIDLIKAAKCLYYKDKDLYLPELFIESNHKDRFNFNVHLSCPFGNSSINKLPYSILADTFGYSNKFQRKDAIQRINDVFLELGLPKDGTNYVYRIFQQIKYVFKNNGTFGNSFNKDTLILYEVEYIKNNIPIFKDLS